MLIKPTCTRHEVETCTSRFYFWIPYLHVLPCNVI